MAFIGLHALMYVNKDEETRRFFRDVLGFRAVDAGRGWLIFAMPPAELAMHPVEGKPYHELYLMCDDIDATVADLRSKGVETQPIQEQRWGRVTQITLPGGAPLGVYEPSHPTAIETARRSTRQPRRSGRARRK